MHFCQFSSVLSHKQQALNSSSPAAASSQAPRLREVLGRCNSQGGPSHRQLRQSMLQREGVPGIQGQESGDKHSSPPPPVWLPPKLPCLDSWNSPHCGQPACSLQPSLRAQVLFQGPLLVPLPAPGPLLQACICSSVAVHEDLPQPPLLPHSTMSVNS